MDSNITESANSIYLINPTFFIDYDEVVQYCYL